MTIAFYRQLLAALQNHSVVVATVVNTRGSVPREVGAKMGIDAQGNTFSTIGGGAGEAKVIHAAREVFATGQKQLIEIDLSGSPQRETQGVCGGFMQVWLERWQGDAAIALAQKILVHPESGQSLYLITPLEQTRSPYLLESEPSDPLAFIEQLQPSPTLLIIGAGHCGIQLAKVADLIGFQVMVQDDRSEWANPSHYPQTARIFTGTIADALTQLETHTQLYAALVTRGFTYDLEALKALLQRQISCHYIGMIGSQKRVHQVFQALEQTGIAADKLKSIYAPIGLDIGALTPEEIAVSISAELIMVRRGGTGAPLSWKR